MVSNAHALGERRFSGQSAVHSKKTDPKLNSERRTSEVNTERLLQASKGLPLATGPAKKPSTGPASPNETTPASASKTVADYVYFLASLEEGASQDPTTFGERAQRILKRASAAWDGSAPSANGVSQTSPVIRPQESADSVDGQVNISAELRLQGSIHEELETESGEITFDASFEIDISASLSMRSSAQPAPNKSDPLALDLNGDGKISCAAGVFDINADGNTDRVPFAKGPDAFLALDRNGNGLIDDGSELFGDQYGAADGFAELAKFDGDHNGVIDARDVIFRELQGVRAATSGGLEQMTLSELGVQAINLDATNAPVAPGPADNVAVKIGSYLSADGSRRGVQDLLLSFEPLSVG